MGGTVSEVVESRASGWSEGDLVVSYYGWQEYSVGTPEDLQWGNKAMPIEKWDGSLGPPSTALGILGMTGYAAYAGLGTVNLTGDQQRLKSWTALVNISKA